MVRVENGVPVPILDTVDGSLEFKIRGYSQLKGMGIGKKIASETFKVGGYSWAIYFYPDGKSKRDKAKFVSLFIGLVSDDTNVKALFELTLKDQSGKERHKVQSHFDRVLETGPHSLKYKGSMWGYKQYFRRERLETSDYLKDDCLHVHCRVGVVKTCTQEPRIDNAIPNPPSDIGQQSAHDEKNFEVDGEEFLEMEDQAKIDLADKQLVMEKVVHAQDENFINQPQEENPKKLRRSLLHRGRVADDILQGERSLVEEDVELLNEKFDELLPLNKSLSYVSQTTTCSLTDASSSSPKSMAPEEQVEESIVQDDSSLTAKKTNHMSYVTTDYQVIDDDDLAENTIQRTNHHMPYATTGYRVSDEADLAENTTERANHMPYATNDYQVIDEGDLSDNSIERTNHHMPYATTDYQVIDEVDLTENTTEMTNHMPYATNDYQVIDEGDLIDSSTERTNQMPYVDIDYQVINEGDLADNTTERTNHRPYVDTNYQVINEGDLTENTIERTNHMPYVTADYKVIDEAGLTENTTERANTPGAYHVELPSPLDAKPTAADDNKDMDDDDDSELELCEF